MNRRRKLDMDYMGLAGIRVLVVEDEYLLADDTRKALVAQGVQVVGPVPTVEGASECLVGEPTIDAALLDINLRGEKAYDVADVLKERGIPFAFLTGYESVRSPDALRRRRSVSEAAPCRPSLVSVGPGRGSA